MYSNSLHHWCFITLRTTLHEFWRFANNCIIRDIPKEEQRLDHHGNTDIADYERELLTDQRLEWCNLLH